MHRHIRPLLVALSLLASVTGLNGQGRARQVGPLYPTAAPQPRDTTTPVDTLGLSFRLTEGDRRAGPREVAAPSRLLDRASALALLRRVRGLTPRAARDSFHFPAQTFPIPRAGRTVQAGFAAADSAAPPPVPTRSALVVTRRAPEGEVPVGAEITVTFSRAMIPLGSVGAAAAHAVPIRMSPAPAGEWRWMDVRTLRFQPVGRLPMATSFQLEIPSGTRAADGTPLEEAVRWGFSTPAASALGAYPNNDFTGLRPIMVVAFDQQVDPGAILAALRLNVAGASYAVVPVTESELRADEGAWSRVRGLPAGRWVAFRADRELPTDAQVRVTLVAGAPSAEGPRVTSAPQEWGFRTYGPFVISRQTCGDEDPCRPGGSLGVVLSNSVAPGQPAGLIEVSPAIEGMEVQVSGSVVMIHGRTRPNTVYTVNISSELRDAYGQSLRSRPLRFRVGRPGATLSSPYAEMTVLDPRAQPLVSVFAAEHPRLRVRVSRMTPEQWPLLDSVQNRRWRTRAAVQLPGDVRIDRIHTVGAGTGQPVEIPIDLRPALEDGTGQLLVAVEALGGRTPEERRQAVYFWVQATRIGLNAATEADSAVVWVSSLVDGRPLGGAAVSLAPGGAGGTTDADGLVRFALPTEVTGEYLLARLGGDVAMLRQGGAAGWANWRGRARSRDARWYAFTDRNLYRPGETVRFRGWIRDMPGHEGATLEGVQPGDELRYRVLDPQGTELAKGTLPLVGFGGFEGTLALPAGTNLGYGAIAMEWRRAGRVDHHTLGFRIEEFRRPEFEVGVTVEGAPHLVGGGAELVARASYFSGEGLPGAEVHWRVNSTPGFFAPAGWEAWRFGAGWSGDDDQAELTGETDVSGSHVARLQFDQARPPRPFQLSATATVLDVNRQSWTSATSLLVHPASVYLGMRSGRGWLEAGDTLDLDLVVVDLDGRIVEDRPIQVEARRFEWKVDGPTWTRVQTGTERCERASGEAPVSCTFPALGPGEWEVTARTSDDRGRPAMTEIRLWVTGGGARFPSAQGNDVRSVDLVPDRELYSPGDTARVLARLPFFPARGVLTVRRDGVMHTEAFHATEPTHVLRVPVAERDVPGMHLHVEVVGGTDGGEGDLPTPRGVDVASGNVTLTVSLATRTLTVTPIPADTASRPDAPGSVLVQVKDNAGRPVPNVDVAVWGVDEAVLALAGYRLPDPIRTFYPQPGANVNDIRLQPVVRVVAPELRAAPGTLVGRVLDMNTGAPISGALVSLVGGSATTTTDAHGRFRLSGVSGSEAVLRAEVAGYRTGVRSLAVLADGTPPLRLYLQSLAAVQQEDQDFAGRARQERQARAGAPPPPPPPPPMAPPPPPPPPAMALAGVVAKDAGGGEPAPDIAIRSNFDALAFWLPLGRTDAAGTLRTTFTLPSSLTRYRVWAVGAEGDTRFGTGESAITVRKALAVRPSAPRFLNFGDRFELPVVVQNGTGRALAVQVAARGDGISFMEPGRSVVVPAYDRVEVRLAAEATQTGIARLQVVIAGGTHTDAAELELPVYTPATAEAFAVYGQLTEGATTLPLEVPGEAIPAFGGLEVSMSSTALTELTDAFLYLVRYPYECAEQKASRILAVAALRDVLSAMNAAEMPSPEQIAASMTDDLRALEKLQNPDGGWGFWQTPDQQSWPMVSIHVAHALQRAREAGFQPNEQTWRRAMSYLSQIPRSVRRDYPPEVQRALHAYALYTRERMGVDVTRELGEFVARHTADSLTLEETGWILAAAGTRPELATERASLLRTVSNRATETPSTATFATSYTEGEYLLMHSSRRTDAVVLEGLLVADPRSELVTKTVRGLLGGRRAGRWSNTQENSWVLLALNRYFRAYEAQTPDFLARVWLGERYAGGAEFRGRSGDRAAVSVPMAALQQSDPESLTIGHQGTGRLYWRAGLRYAPRDLDLRPLERGFAVERIYEAVDDTGDVRRGSDGVWRVRAGARLRVTVTITAPARRVHVAMTDPMAAGWEPINPALRGSEPAPQGTLSEAQTRGGWWWRWWWFEHQNLRDDRAEAFTSLLPAGVHTYSYMVRATTPGSYIVPPTRVEEMYSPETFGRAATERVIVQ